MIVVAVRDDNRIDNWDILDLARQFGVALGTQPLEWRTAVLENRVEEDSQTIGKLDIVACMTQPCCAQMGGFPAGKKLGFLDWHGWRSSIGMVRLSS